MGSKPYDPFQGRKRTWRGRLMVPGAIAAILLVVAAGTTLTVIGVMRLLDSPSAAETGIGASPITRAGATGDQQPIVPLATVAPTAVPTTLPTVMPTVMPTAVPTAVPIPPPTPPPTAVVTETSQNLIADVYERLKGSVVRISTDSDSVGIGQPYGEAGSGFVIDEAGHILTNFHVIKDGKELRLTLNDGTQLRARVIGTDPGSDVALLQANIPPDKLVVAPLGSSAAVRVGDQVIAIGSPFYIYRNTMSSGHVSGLRRPYAFSGRTITGMIQSDAAINRGSSGGPLIDLKNGEVIGITTAIATQNFAGIALALPIDLIKRILPDLLAGKTPTHAWLPIHGTSITPHIAAQCNLPVDYGVIVFGILPGSKLNNDTFVTGANGDIIVSIDDLPVRNLDILSEYIDTHKKPGDTVELRVYRQRKENLLLTVTLEEWPNKIAQRIPQAVDCSSPTSEPINAPTVPPITAETSTKAANGRFIISAEPLMPAIAAAMRPMAAPPTMPATMPRAAMRSDDPMAAVSAAVA